MGEKKQRNVTRAGGLDRYDELSWPKDPSRQEEPGILDAFEAMKRESKF